MSIGSLDKSWEIWCNCCCGCARCVCHLEWCRKEESNSTVAHRQLHRKMLLWLVLGGRAYCH